MSIAQASYMTESTELKRVRKPMVAMIVAFFIAFMAIFSGVLNIAASSSGSSSQTVQAGPMGFVCAQGNSLGSNMDQGPWDSGMGIPHREAGNRTWTAQEAFGNNIGFANYNGEGEAKDRWFVSATEKERGKAVSPDAWGANVSKYEGIRTFSNCTFVSVFNKINNVGLSFAGGISRIAQIFAVFAFDSSIICDTAAGGSNCINLLKIIGGPDVGGASTQGLIGTLTSGVYIPMLVMIVAISAMWVAYRGIVQRKFREALFGAAWICLAVLFGLTFLYKPALLAKAPMAVSNTVSACVVGGFTGNSCWDGGAGTATSLNDGTLDSQKICKSSAAGLDITEQMSMSVNGLSCSIWEAFVLEPYAQGSFGRSVDELNVKNPVVAAAISKAKLNPNDFCVNLTSGSSADSMGSTLEMTSSSNRVCNLAVYQAYLSTNAKSGSDQSNKTSSTPDTRWYKIIDTVASDKGMWEKWSPDGSGHRAGVVFVASVASVLGSIVIIVISFFALLYYLTSVLMITFAPLFFLVGVHPGRGRSILIGWAENIFSNILKYMASAFFLIITIAFYAAVLGSAKNIGMTLLFILVLTGALLLYRKEIVNLIGKVNMGGERLSNRMGERLEKFGDSTKRTAIATTGSAVGAAINAPPTMDLRSYREGWKEDGLKGAFGAVARDAKKNADRAGTVWDGGKDGLKRELKKGGGFVANASRQYDRITQDNKRDLEKQAKTARDEANASDAKLAAVDKDVYQQRTDVNVLKSDANNSTQDYQAAETRENERREVDGQVLNDFNSNPEAFQQMQIILNRLSEFKNMQRLARADGDHAKADAIGQNIAQEERNLKTLINENPDGLMQMYGNTYQTVRNQRYAAAGVSTEDVRAGRVSEQDAFVARSKIAMELNQEFQGNFPALVQLESSLQRLEALNTERDIALRLGDVDTAHSYDAEIDSLERAANKYRGGLSNDMENAFDENMNNLKDNRYKAAGLSSRTETAEADREDFIGKAVAHQTNINRYNEAANNLNENVAKRNALADTAAHEKARSEVLDEATLGMRPGSSMRMNKADAVRREAEYQGQKAADADRDQVGVKVTDFDASTARNMDGGRITPRMPVQPASDEQPEATDSPSVRPSRLALEGNERNNQGKDSDGPPPPPVGGGRLPVAPAPTPNSGGGNVIPGEVETPRPQTNAPVKAETANRTVKEEGIEGTVLPPVATDRPQTSTPKVQAQPASDSTVVQPAVNTEPVTPAMPKPTQKDTEWAQKYVATTPRPSEKEVAVAEKRIAYFEKEGVTPGNQSGAARAYAEQKAVLEANEKHQRAEQILAYREPVAPTPQQAASQSSLPAQEVRTEVRTETVREVTRETPAPVTPAPTPQIIREEGQPVQIPSVTPTNVESSTSAPAQPREVARETVVKETPLPTPNVVATPASQPEKVVTNPPAQVTNQEPARQETVIKTVTEQAPSAGHGIPVQPTAEAPRQASPQPQAVTDTTPRPSTPEVKEVVKETVREVPAASPTITPQTPPSVGRSPEIREVVREVPTSSNTSGTTPTVAEPKAVSEPREVIKETVKESPIETRLPQAPAEARPQTPEVREIIRETAAPTPPQAPVQPEIREVVRETPAPNSSAPIPQQSPVPDSRASVEPREVIKETVREVPSEPRTVTPPPSSPTPEVREVIREVPVQAPSQPQQSPVPDSRPSVETREVIRETVREVPSEPRVVAPQPSSSTPEVREVIREVVRETPAPSASTPTPQQSPVADSRASAEPKEVIKETVREVPSEPRVVAPQPNSSAPEVREVIREVPVQASTQPQQETPRPAATETVREVVKEVPVVEVRETVREVVTPPTVEVREVPATTHEVKEVIREVPAAAPAQQSQPEVIRETRTTETVREVQVESKPQTSSSNNMSDDDIRALIRERGDALSSRERATIEETMRTANSAQPSSSGNESMLQRAAEAARQERDAMVAKMMEAQASSDAQHASEMARMQDRVANAERAATEARRSSTEASRGHGIPTAPSASHAEQRREEASSPSNKEQASSPTNTDNDSSSVNRDSDSNNGRERSSRNERTSGQAQAAPQSSSARENVADNQPKGDRTNAPKSRFGRKKPKDGGDGKIDFSPIRPPRR